MHDRITDIWGTRTPHAQGAQWPGRVDQYLAEDIAESEVEWVQSACVLCSDGCGMDIGVRDGRIVGVRGRAVDRVNHGRLGPKGLYGWQANNSPDRLTRPLVRRNGRLEPAGWDEAMELVVAARGTSSTSRGRSGWASTTRGSCSSRTTTRWRSSCAAASARRTSTATRGSARRPRTSPSRRRLARTAPLGR